MAQNPNNANGYGMASDIATRGLRLAAGGGSNPVRQVAKEAGRAAAPLVVGLARKKARAKRLEEIKKRRASGARGKASAPQSKLDGVGFWMIMGVAIVKDAIDPVATLLQLLFATSGTAVTAGLAAGEAAGSGLAGGIVGGAVKALDFLFPGVIDTVDLGLGAAIWFMAVGLSLSLTFVIWFYLFYRGVSMTPARLLVIGGSLIIGIIPFINWFPETVLMLILIKRGEKKGG